MSFLLGLFAQLGHHTRSDRAPSFTHRETQALAQHRGVDEFHLMGGKVGGWVGGWVEEKGGGGREEEELLL